MHWIANLLLSAAGPVADPGLAEASDGGWLSRLSPSDKALLFGGVILIGFGVLVGPISRRLRGEKKSPQEREMESLISRLRGATPTPRIAGSESRAHEPVARLTSRVPVRDESAAISRLEEATHRCLERIDQRARRIESLLAQIETRLGSPATAPPARSPAAPAHRPSAHSRLSPSGAGAEPGRQSRLVLDPGRATDPLNERILELASEGRTPVEIAQTLNEHLGKVELILALHAQ